MLTTTVLTNLLELSTVTKKQIAALDGVGRTHEDPGDRLQPGSQTVLSALVWAGQCQEGGSHRLYAETADDTQRDTQATQALADGTAATCLTVKTVADLAIHGVALLGWRDAEQSCGHLDRTTRLFSHRPDSHRHTRVSISLEY
jgi:hypothetical protein